MITEFSTRFVSTLTGYTCIRLHNNKLTNYTATCLWGCLLFPESWCADVYVGVHCSQRADVQVFKGSMHGMESS